MKKSSDFFCCENINKYILPNYDLENSKISLIKFKDTLKQRAVYRIESSNISYCLKKVYFDRDTLLFVYSALEWIFRNNINVPKLLPTIDNHRFVEFRDMIFILTPWVDGEKCNFDTFSDLELSISELAKLHIKTKNFIPIEGSSTKYIFDNLYISTLKHFEQLLKNSTLAKNSNDKFSDHFKKHFEDSLFLAENSLKVVSTLDEKKLSTSLCHGDYVNKNIIISNSKVCIIDFDKCRYGYSAYDISYFLRRLLRRTNTNWNLNLTLTLLKSYNSINKLSPSDLKFIFSYICFPQKFWKLSKDYYKKIGNKKELEKSFKNSCLLIKDQVKFTKELLNIFSNINWDLNNLH